MLLSGIDAATFFEFLYLNLYLVLRNKKIFDISKQNEKLLYIINFILTKSEIFAGDKKRIIRETQESEEFDNKFIYMLELLERKICKLIF